MAESVVDRPPHDAEVAGRPIWFTRRRYGRQTYTWVHVLVNGQLVDLGDPWPCINPKRSEIAREIELLNGKVVAK